MTTIFWNSKGIIFIDFLENRCTIQYYSVLLYQDTTQFKKLLLLHHVTHQLTHHRCEITWVRLGIAAVPTVFVRFDFRLFSIPQYEKLAHRKKLAQTKKSLPTQKPALKSWKHLTFLAGLKKWLEHWEKCILLKGDYVETSRKKFAKNLRCHS